MHNASMWPIKPEEKKKKRKKAYGKRSSTPGTSTPDLAHIAQDVKGSLVAEGHVDDSVVRERAHRRDDRALLSAAHRGRADEEARVLAPQGALHPQLARLVPEGLPLGREVAVAGGHAEEKGIVLLEHGRVVKGGDAAVLGWGVHLFEDLVGQCFWYSDSS